MVGAACPGTAAAKAKVPHFLGVLPGRDHNRAAGSLLRAFRWTGRGMPSTAVRLLIRPPGLRRRHGGRSLPVPRAFEALGLIVPLSCCPVAGPVGVSPRGLPRSADAKEVVLCRLTETRRVRAGLSVLPGWRRSVTVCHRRHAARAGPGGSSAGHSAAAGASWLARVPGIRCQLPDDRRCVAGPHGIDLEPGRQPPGDRGMGRPGRRRDRRGSPSRAPQGAQYPQ